MATKPSNVVELRYVARAGLLPELTRQTYDSLFKALREVILNSVDAGADHVVIDLSAVETTGALEISDNGAGMSLGDLQQSFMSLGGSRKFGSKDKFGRIGIGSLALMHYAQSVEIETKQQGAGAITRATISHPWALDKTQRAQELDDFPAGEAWVEKTDRIADHFTVMRLNGVDQVLLSECADVGNYFKLVDRLRRILPLSWPPAVDVSRQLSGDDPELVELLRAHTSALKADVVLRSRWASDEPLTKRVYGDGIAQDERWNGTPRSIRRELIVEDSEGERTIMIAGYLLSQARPSADWSGVTARVQNVAVEERTFFDLESDPGFRKYITGEIWLLGDVDRARLINIDRTSFNRESADYRAVARAMQVELTRFKAECVQAPQRAKVAIKRRLDQQVALQASVTRVGRALAETLEESALFFKGMPSSNNGRIRASRQRSLIDDLRALGAVVAIRDFPGKGKPYELHVAKDGRRIVVEVADDLAQPRVILAGVSYAIRILDGRPIDPPILVRNRPREVTFNLTHDIFRGELRDGAADLVMALEAAYLISPTGPGDELYDRILRLLAVP